MRATGTLRDLVSGSVRHFRTDGSGVYTLNGIAPGRYRLELSSAGFVPWSEVLEVGAGTSINREITLRLGTASERIDVVEALPLAGLSVTTMEVAAPVQSVKAEQFAQRPGLASIADVLNFRLAGVNVNENQENPYQPDVNYRGYTASPLLGTPEGISVYMDGVRINQPFADIVSWDLIPKVAILETTLLPGSNPVFGLNTLGGALSIQTKDGNTNPGLALQITGGSNGRRAVELEQGGLVKGGFHYYLAGNLFHDDGWRPLSPSDVRQAFSRLGWQGGKTSAGLSFSFAGNDLWGHGPQEVRLLSQNYSSGYTLSDETRNRSPLLNLTLRRAQSSAVSMSGNLYYRYIGSTTFNTDFNADSLNQAMYQPNAAEQAALLRAGYTGFPTSGANAANTPFPKWRCIAQALQLAEPAEKCNGALARSWTRQHNSGGAAQMTWSASRGNLRNRFTPGFAIDRSGLNFTQTQEFAYINPDRTMTGVGVFADGSTNVDDVPFDRRVNLRGQPRTLGLFATDTLSGKNWSVTASVRYNRAAVDNFDRITPVAGPGSLTAKYVFSRLNPAIGVTFAPLPGANAYMSYSEANRSPSSIELGCSDPENPCHLPSAAVSDPELDQVVARTLEAGVRSASESRVEWSIGWFRANNSRDILFVASPQTNRGYFKNFGKTRRQGGTVAVAGRYRTFSIGGNYTYLRATYETAERINASANSASNGGPGFGGNIQILPGNHLPNLPGHIFKAYVDWNPTKRITAEAVMNVQTSAFAAGNENNQHRPDNRYYFGNGILPGFAVLNLAGAYQMNRYLSLFGQVTNAFNRHYYTSATLAVTGFTPQGTYLARPFTPVNGIYPLIHSTFYSPGAPRAVTGGIRVHF